MKQEDKQLLLKDLCERLPYGVICHTEEGNGRLCSINQTIFGTEYGINISHIKRDYFNDSEQDEVVIKPYLRPMESMTEKETYIFHQDILNEVEARCIHSFGSGKYSLAFTEANDWLNEHHFDFRDLIEKGLALEAPEDMYQTA